MRTILRHAAVVGLLLAATGCDSAMTDISIKPEITGNDEINSVPADRRSKGVEAKTTPDEAKPAH